MKVFNELKLKFEYSDWSKNPEFGVIDTILEFHPEIYNIFKSRIKETTLKKVLVEIVKFAIDEDHEDISKIRTDSTVIKSNIQYLTSIINDDMKFKPKKPTY